jgi:hypothetical protein
MIQTPHNVSRVHNRTHFFKYTSASVAKIIFTNRTLRWSSPILFNDPFDVHRELGPNVSPTSVLSAGAPFYLRRVAETLGIKLTPNVLSAFLGEMNTSIPNPPEAFSGFEEAMSKVKQFWRETVCKLRILCLSEDSDIVSMWAHYASNHHGVVLRFDCSDFKDSPLLLAKPVRYSAELPSFATAEGWAKGLRQSVTSDDQINLFEQYCYLKTADWETEREWRVVTVAREHETGYYSDWRFAPLTLSEVIFGHQIDQQDRRDILAMLSHDFGHVRAFDAVLGSGNKFDFREVSRSHFVNVLKDESKLIYRS